MEQEYKLGAIKSPEDYRDHKYSDKIASITIPETLPESYSLDTSFASVWNQIHTSSCVAHAVAKAMQIYWFKKTGKIIDFSPRFLYILSGSVDNLGPSDGRYPRTVLKIATSIGCCTTTTLPNDTTLPDPQYCDPLIITQAMYDEASQYKIPGYLSVALNDYEIRHAIYHNGAVSMLFRIGNELWTPDSLPKSINPLRTPQNIVGGHEMVGKGWNTTMDRLLNSWGQYWCLNGEADYNYQAWKSYIEEVWCISDPSLDWQILTQNLPSPKTFHYNWTHAMSVNDSGDDVKALQTALMIDGCLKLDPSIPLGFFGPLTKQAVIKFQEKYASEILSPIGLTKGTGLVGAQTLKKLNQEFK